MDVEKKWYENYLNNRDRQIRCSICDEDEIVGLVSLTNINRLNQNAVLHIMIGEQKKRAKGAGLFGVTEILKHAFKDINLYRIELQVLKSNLKALGLYEKIGFVKEAQFIKMVNSKI